jgi:hypothetical protein
MSAEAEIVARLRERLSVHGINRLKECRDLVHDTLSKAWLNTTLLNTFTSIIDLSTELARVLHLRTIIDGYDDLENFSGVIVVSNHLGAAKLLKTNRRAVNSRLPVAVQIMTPMTGRLLNSDSFLVLFAPVIAATITALPSKKLEFIPVSIRYEGSFGESAERLGFVQFNTAHSSYSSLRNQIETRILCARSQGAIPVVIIFPEGGTTGKRETRDPFKLEPFHHGFLNISRDFNLAILPIVVTFDSMFKFQARVLFSGCAEFVGQKPQIETIRRLMQWNIDQAL